VEKGHQVQLMSEIYANASQVIAFMGIEDQYSTRAFHIVRELQSRIAPFLNGLGVISTEASQLVEALERSRRTSIKVCRDAANSLSNAWRRLGPEDLTALKLTFRQRTYWSRLWIIQEIMLSRRVVLYCGDDELSWTYLERLCLISRILQEHFTSSIYVAMHSCFNLDHGVALTRGMFKSKTLYIESIQELLCNCSCENPKDYVYGMLGILNLTKSTIYPNYKKSVSWIYLEATRSIIREYGNLDYLCLPKARILEEDHELEAQGAWISMLKEQPVYLSSWTLDWSANYSNPFLEQITAAQPRLDVDTALSTDESCLLLLKGICCSRVTFVSETFEKRHDRAKQIVRTIPGYDDTDEMCSIIRTLLQDRYGTRHSAGILHELKEADLLVLLSFYGKWIGLDIEKAIPNSWKGRIGYLKVSHPILSSYACETFDEIFEPYRLNRLSFIRTSSGGTGLAFGNLNFGDEIWNVYGAKAPLILRPKKSNYEQNQGRLTNLLVQPGS
jgi:hypothetical protein